MFSAFIFTAGHSFSTTKQQKTDTRYHIYNLTVHHQSNTSEIHKTFPITSQLPSSSPRVMVSKTALARCHRQHNLPAKNAAISAIFLPSFDFSSKTHQHTNQSFIEDSCLFPLLVGGSVAEVCSGVLLYEMCIYQGYYISIRFDSFLICSLCGGKGIFGILSSVIPELNRFNDPLTRNIIQLNKNSGVETSNIYLDFSISFCDLYLM